MNDNVWIADFETESELFYNKYGYTKTWLCYIENLNNDDSYMCIDIDVFIEFILKRFRKRMKNQYVYFHNLSFDGTFIMYALHNMGIEFECVVNENKKMYEIKIWSSNKKRYISFRCSYMIFMCSVSSLPNSSKSVIDYMRIRDYKSIKDATDHEKYYIEQDVKTVKYNLQQLQEKFDVKLNGRFKTNASISYKEIKRLSSINLKSWGYSWEDLMPKLSYSMDSYIRKAYNGGYTYLNPKHKDKVIDVEVCSYDMVSSYPTRQRNDYLPYGMPVIKSKLSDDDIAKDRLYIARLKIYKADIKEGLMPFISVNKATKYLMDDIYSDHIERVVLSLTCIDLELMIKYYDVEYEVLDYCVFPMKAKGVFNEYIDKHFKVKSESKKIKKSSKDEEEIKTAIFNEFISKLRINSAYGKFGTNPTMTSSVPHFEDEMLTWTKEEVVKEETIFYLPVACFITAYGRKALIEPIQENCERFIYCDTDSMKMIGVDPPKGVSLGSKLGQWEFEYIATRSKFLKAKQYIHEIEGKMKRTICSMSRTQHDRVDFKNFYIGSEFIGGKKVSKAVKGGRIIKDADFRFR